MFSNSITIGDKRVGGDSPVFFIAEAGVAHFGSFEKALKLVDLAVDAKADAVKFQTFRSVDMISSELKDWQDRMKTRELPFDDFSKIQTYCKQRGIIFMSTAHDDMSFEYLQSLNLPAYKIGSGEVNNWPYLEKVASLGKPVILSTGMYSFDEIEKTIDIFKQSGNKRLALLHCVTAYPVPPEEVNLRAIQTLRERFGTIVGYSDHTAGCHFPLAAVAMGAKVIEKHISLDFNIPNAQDWKVSCGPNDLGRLVSDIREIERGLGTGIKGLTKAEENSLVWARKSLVTSRPIKAGEVITPDLLVGKRPGTGISPSQMSAILGKKAKIDLAEDQVLRWEHIQ